MEKNLIVFFHESPPCPPPGVSKFVRKRPVDDHVPDPDVRRRDRQLQKTVFRFDMHGVDDDVPSFFENFRTGGPDLMKDARLAAGSFAVGARLFPDLIRRDDLDALFGRLEELFRISDERRARSTSVVPMIPGSCPVFCA